MAHLGALCPDTPGHLNPMTGLALALRNRGHRITFFMLGDPPASIAAAGFETVPLGGSVFTPEEYRSALQKLGLLEGRAALKHTIGMGVRSTEAILEVGPGVVRSAGVTALLVDQVRPSGGTVAEQLGLPIVTVCNALIINPDPLAPPFFTHWQPRNAWWARARNRIYWAGLDRLFAPMLKHIQTHRQRLGLSVPRRIQETWSNRLQISQQPESFEFPRRDLPKQMRFVSPFLRPADRTSVPFPWERLDGRPLIYASLGTLQNRLVGAFRMIAEACDGLDAQLVISTGHGITPESLGKLPGDPVVVPYAPQLELLGRAALVITHAGLNTALESLSKGVPMVAIPVTNDQPGVAARIVWTGAGQAIALKRLTSARLRRLVVEVLREKSYRTAAERIRDAIASGGGAPRAAEVVEQSLVGEMDV